VISSAKGRLFYSEQNREEFIRFLYDMDESNFMIFSAPLEVNNMLNASKMPKSATLFYHENRWWYELKTGKELDNELCQRESSFSRLRKTSGRLDVALGPFGKKFLLLLYIF
jgi:hypothetical protein